MRGGLSTGMLLLFVLFVAAVFGATYWASTNWDSMNWPGADIETASASSEVPVAASRAPQPTDPELAAAVEAYRAGDYDRALTAFAALADDEADASRAAILHANAGTAAARSEQLGEAVWHLLRARRLDPADATAAANLGRVRALVGGGATEASQLTDTLATLPLHAGEGQLERWAFRLAGAGLLVAAVWRLLPRRRGLGWLAALLVALPLVGLAWSSHARDAAARQAVVLGDVVVVRAEPQGDGRILLRTGGGTVVEHEEDRGGWRLIETPEGGRGWVDAEQVRPVGR